MIERHDEESVITRADSLFLSIDSLRSTKRKCGSNVFPVYEELR